MSVCLLPTGQQDSLWADFNEIFILWNFIHLCLESSIFFIIRQKKKHPWYFTRTRQRIYDDILYIIRGLRKVLRDIVGKTITHFTTNVSLL